MRKLLFVAICLVTAVSCKQEKSGEDLAATRQRDSLNQIITQRDNELNDLMATFNEIEEGFKEINQAERRVTIAKQGEGSTREQRIRENIQFIQSTMTQNRELINKLKRQLRESAFQGDQFKRTIENLTAQLEEKDRELQQLRAELNAKDTQIAELDQKITGLNSDVSSLKEENSQKTGTISAQDKQLNTAWFVFGTKSELKDQNILVDGKVLRSNFNHDYFTKIDIRVEKEIKLYSRSAKILTSHPAGSYTLQPNASKQYVLRITNPQQFWSTSKYLVIQVK